jgi:hypothetical protein
MNKEHFFPPHFPPGSDVLRFSGEKSEASKHPPRFRGRKIPARSLRADIHQWCYWKDLVSSSGCLKTEAAVVIKSTLGYDIDWKKQDAKSF